MSVNVASRLASIALSRSKLLRGAKTYERAPAAKKGGYYVYSGSKVPAVQVWTGGGGTSYGAGAGDRLSNVPQQQKIRKKPDFSLEDILDLVKDYRGQQSRQASLRMIQAALQAYGKLPRLRHETGELNYNPIYGTYRARKTWFRPYPYIHNILDPTFYREPIEGRMRRARRDFYINQIRRIGPLIDTLLEPGAPGPGGENKECAESIEEARRLNIPLCSKNTSAFQIKTRNVRQANRIYRKKSYRPYSRKKSYNSQSYNSRRYFRRF